MFNSWFPESKDRLPLTWWKQYPVYLSGLLALAGAASMVIYALLGSGLMRHLTFSVPSAFRDWHLWTPVTYVLVNPPSLWTLIGCYLLWSFGEGVERHLGRRAFVTLLALLLFSSPLLTTVAHFAGAPGVACAGMTALEFGVFIGFATLYPRAKINLLIVSIDAWILAAVFVGINALQSLAGRDWTSLLLLAGNVGLAHAFVRFEKGEFKWLGSSGVKQKRVKPPRTPKAAKFSSKTSPGLTADDILDKISREGIHSLTAKERRILEQASRSMKRRK